MGVHLFNCALHRLLYILLYGSFPKARSTEEILEWGGPACEGTDHLSWFVYRSSHSAKFVVCFGIRTEGGACASFFSIHMSVHMCLTICSSKVVFLSIRGVKSA